MAYISNNLLKQVGTPTVTKKRRLELSWVGKQNQPLLEPRLLLEDQTLSYHATRHVCEQDKFDNRLIYGDNLLALKALEQEFTGCIKCVYIDPPFNTGQAFEHYDDGIEHSLWLSLMRDRIQILHSLLSVDGSLFVEIDDTESSYLQVLLDEVFGRRNRVLTVSVKRSAATGHKTINPTPVNVTEYIHIYAKDKSHWKYKPTYVPRKDYDWAYSVRLVNPDEPYQKWEFEPLRNHVASVLGFDSAAMARREMKKKLFDEEVVGYALDHPREVIRFAQPNYSGVSQAARNMIDESKERVGQVMKLERSGYSDMYFKDGNRILFLADKVISDGETTSLVEPLTNWWDDIPWQGIAREGGVVFPKSKKPEKLIKRILDIATEPGDWVLDSFAGSGTTGAVAHKMHRRWIMVELGEHCHSHIIPRMQTVISGDDSTGVSKAVNWKGGGGYRYYRLGPTLIVEDEWGNPIINPEFNAGMLAQAMCKLEGFTFDPNAEVYWQQGRSSEMDFIYVTTQFMSKEMLTKISDEVGPNRSLLICCSAFRCDVSKYENLTVKKIPKAVLRKCEWGHDDYSLEIKNLPDAQPELLEQRDAEAADKKKLLRKSSKDSRQMLLGLGETDAQGDE